MKITIAAHLASAATLYLLNISFLWFWGGLASVSSSVQSYEGDYGFAAMAAVWHSCTCSPLLMLFFAPLFDSDTSCQERTCFLGRAGAHTSLNFDLAGTSGFFCARLCSALIYLGRMFILLGFHSAIWHAVTHHANRGTLRQERSCLHAPLGAYSCWN